MTIDNPAYPGTGVEITPPSEKITVNLEMRVPNVTGGVSKDIVSWKAGLDGTLDMDAAGPLLEAALNPADWDALTAGAFDADEWAKLGDGEVGVYTDENGEYLFDNLPTAYTDAEGQHFLASYRVKLYETHVDYDGTGPGGTGNPDDDNYWLLTKSHIGDDLTIDSDVLSADTLAIEDRDDVDAANRDRWTRVNDGQVILAAPVATPDGSHESHVRVPASQLSEGAPTAYDWLTIRKTGDDVEIRDVEAEDGTTSQLIVFRGGDAGQLPAPRRDISGVVWNDVNSNGIQDPGEPGYASSLIQIELLRFVPDENAADGWAPDPSWTPRLEYPGRGGWFCFENLPSQRREADGTTTVFAYRAWVKAAPDVRYTLFIAKYQQGTDYTVDSDLRYDDSYLMNLAVDEYDVLLDKRVPESFADNVVKAAPSNNPNQHDSAMQTAVNAMSRVMRSARAASPLTYNYDLAMSSSRDSNDGGVEIPPSADIAGYVWNDQDYDGLLDEGEERFAGKSVTLRRWYYDPADGQWKSPGADAGFDPVRTIQTDADGHFLFENMPVSMRIDDTERWYLQGYTLEIDGRENEPTGVGGRPVTLWQQVNGPDSAAEDEKVNSKAVRPVNVPADQRDLYDLENNYPIAYNLAVDAGAPVVDGRLVLCNPAVAGSGTEPEYIVRGYDITSPADRIHMNAGFGNFQTTTLRGVVWNDVNYNGIREYAADRLGDDPMDPDSVVIGEAGLAGIEMRLTRWLLVDGTWTPDAQFADSFADEIAASVGTASEMYAKPGDAAVYAKTGADGVYEFTDLPGFVPKGTGADKDEFYLAAYHMEVVRDATTSSSVVTRFHVEDATIRTDSDLATDVDDVTADTSSNYHLFETYPIVQPDGTTTGYRSEGLIIVAKPRSDQRASQYKVVANGGEYDPLDPMVDYRGGDAGFKVPSPVEIAGTVWVDADGDGIRNYQTAADGTPEADADGNPVYAERGLPGQKVELRRYWYDVLTRTWIFDERLAPANGGVAVTTTDAAGDWIFEKLPAFEVLTAESGLLPADEESRPVVFGYRVNIPSIPDEYAVTDLNVGGDGTVDSDLDETTTRILPDDPQNGLFVPMQEAEADEDLATLIKGPAESTWENPDHVGLWSQANVVSSYHNDAGLVPYAGAVIAGLVWDDADLDGIQAESEQPLPLGTVYLERMLVPQDESPIDPDVLALLGWTLTDGAAKSNLDGVSGEPLVPAVRVAPTGRAAVAGPADAVGARAGRRRGAGRRRRGCRCWCRRRGRGRRRRRCRLGDRRPARHQRRGPLRVLRPGAGGRRGPVLPLPPALREARRHVLRAAGPGHQRRHRQRLGARRPAGQPDGRPVSPLGRHPGL